MSHYTAYHQTRVYGKYDVYYLYLFIFLTVQRSIYLTHKTVGNIKTAEHLKIFEQLFTYKNSHGKTL